LKDRKEFNQFLSRQSRKWKITLSAIEEARFTDFNFHEDYLTSIFDQLFENITLIKKASGSKKK
jgi:hypothetical protein